MKEPRKEPTAKELIHIVAMRVSFERWMDSQNLRNLSYSYDDKKQMYRDPTVNAFWRAFVAGALHSSIQAATAASLSGNIKKVAEEAAAEEAARRKRDAERN